MQNSFEEAVEGILRKHPEYAPDAYYFMRAAIEYAADNIKSDSQSRHLSAQELYLGACAYALEEYGPLAYNLLSFWRMETAHDFGCVVYNLIEARIFGRQNDDSQEDFDKLPPLEAMLNAPYELNIADEGDEPEEADQDAPEETPAGSPASPGQDIPKTAAPVKKKAGRPKKKSSQTKKTTSGNSTDPTENH